MRLRTETRPIGDLVPYERNSKKHPQTQIDAIKASITRFGFNDPIGVTEAGVIVEGHGRHVAAQQLGFTEVPVIVIPGEVTEDMIDLYRIAHNKIALNSTFDFVKLREELADIITQASVSFADMGFDRVAVGRLGLLADADELDQAGMSSGHPSDGVGLDFQIVWDTKEERIAFQAFGEKVKATYGGTLGSALVFLMRDVQSGHVSPTTGLGYNPAATAADVEALTW